MSKDIYHNKQDFAKEEFATELYKPKGQPRPREMKSQKAQYDSMDAPGAVVERKDKKTKMTDKLHK
jgi:hypothetical protein